MSRIDEDRRPFIPVRIAVLTVSDTRNEKTDKSGALLASMIEQAGHQSGRPRHRAPTTPRPSASR